MKFVKILVITLLFFCILFLYFINDANKHLGGIIFDAFWINFLTVLYFLLIHLTYKISLPDKYYQLCKFEKSGILFRIIGVRYFKLLLVKNPFPVFTRRVVLKGHSEADLLKVEREMREIETVHFLALVSTFLIVIPFGWLRDTRFFYLITIFNIIENFYPILVQRYNRNRINKMINILPD
jgi:hypothetical protein